jgi:hypothetical protein
MDPVMQLASLDEAERYISVGNSHIERQEQIVADIDSDGRDSAAARECLGRSAKCKINTLPTVTALSKSKSSKAASVGGLFHS